MSDRTSRLEGLKILVVDCDRDSQALLSYFFADYGIDTVAAESVAAALAVLARQPIDLLITEIALPIQDGYSLLKQLPERIPAIAITSYLLGDSADLWAAGFNCVLTKPVKLDELLRVVIQLISHGRLNPEN